MTEPASGRLERGTGRALAVLPILLVALPLLVSWWVRTWPTADDGSLLEQTSWSSLRGLEWWALAFLVLLRLLHAWRWRRRELAPALDLPLAGFTLAVTGGGLSVLDPALPLAYVAVLVFRRGAVEREVSFRHVALSLFLGLVGIHLLVTWHDRQRLLDFRERQAAELELQLEARQAGLNDPLDDVRLPLGLEGEPDPYDPLRLLPERAPLQEAWLHLDRFRQGVALCQTRQDLADLCENTLPDVERALSDGWYQAREQDFELPDLDAETCEDLREGEALNRESVKEILSHVREMVGTLEEVLANLDRTQQRLENLRRQSIRRRALLGIAMVLFALLAINLRDHLRNAVQQVAEVRRRRDVELQERETRNWIALTAGLTHGLGNDILASDVFLADLEQALGPTAQEPQVSDRLAFLRESNRGRLAFLQFLEAFAVLRKSAAAGAPASPLPTTRIDLVRLFQDTRQHLGIVETAALPPAGSDPAVDRQIARLRDLDLEVDAVTEEAGILAQGNRGVVEFFAYELIKNALRNASGAQPLRLRLQRRADEVHLQLTNDVRVERSRGTCASCGRQDQERVQVLRRRDVAPSCPTCFPGALQELLDSSFEPGTGGGTGLGLFLIRYFVSAFRHGSIQARVVDPTVPLVGFELVLPDRPTASHDFETPT